MKTYTVVGYLFDSTFYCSAACLPQSPEGYEHQAVTVDSDEVSAVLAGDEWDYYPVCDHCKEVVEDVQLTDDGRRNEAARRFKIAASDDSDWANLDDWNFYDKCYHVWLASIVSTPIIVFADNEQDALDEAVDWAEDKAPGYFVEDADIETDEDGNEVDVIRAGNHGLALPSDEVRVKFHSQAK